MPLAIGGDDVPRSGVAVAAAEHVVVSVEIVVPEGGVIDVAGIELPVLRRVVEARELALTPFVERDVEQALDDRRALSRDLFFEAVDRVVAADPRRARDELAYADDKNVFVVGAAEDADEA